MPIAFRCSGCNALLRVADDAAGRRIRCGRCQTVLTAPREGRATPPAPPAVPTAESLPRARVANSSAAVPEPIPLPPPPPAPKEEPLELPPDDHPTEPTGPAKSKPSMRDLRPVGAPRRSTRPRRPEPKPLPIVRVLMVVGAVATLALAGVGYLGWRFVTAPAEWQTFESARGGFATELPTAPRDDITSRIGFPPQPGMTVEGTTRRSVVYAVVWGDFPGGRNQWTTDDQVLDASVQGMQTEFAKEQISPPERITADGFPGREVVVTVSGEGTYVFRVVVAEARLYIIAAGPTSSSENPDVRRFLGSFRVTDAKLKAVGQKRAEDAKRAKEESERLEAERQKQAEAARLHQEEQRRKEKEAAAAARAEAEGAAAKFRAPQPDVSAPDPTKLAGLKLYLSFDDVKGTNVPVWPKGSLDLTRELSVAPGVRGNALYSSVSAGELTARGAVVREGAVNGPNTVAGWVKAKAGYGVDVLRTHATHNGVTSTVGVVRRARGRFAAYARVGTSNFREWFPGETSAGTLSAPCPDDDKWHHVALVRGGAAPNRVRLHLDGELVGTFSFPPGPNFETASLVFGALTGVEFEPRPAPRPDGLPEPPVAAADEICVFDRPLSGDEVKYLAGRGDLPAPSAQPAVRLVDALRISPVAGVAFDPERKAMWAVSAVGGYWRADDRLKVGIEKPPTYLLRYSYPDLKLTGRWAFPAQRRLEAVGGVPVLDVKNNRLFVPLGYWTENSTHLQKEVQRYGSFYRFDLNELPKSEPGAAPPVLTPAAQAKADGSDVGNAAVSPDGEWFYYTGRGFMKNPALSGNGVFRVAPDLVTKAEEVFVPGHFIWGQPLWLAPDGKTVRVLQGGNVGSFRPPAPPGLLEIDTAIWAERPLREINGVEWQKFAPAQPVTVHPDGRVFAGGPAGVIETIYEGTAAKRRVRPVPLPPHAFLAASADGKFLFGSEAETKQNRFFVLDARPNPGQSDELAVITETDARRVGGPFWVSPDGQLVVFRSGVVLWVQTDAAQTPPFPPRPEVVPKEIVKEKEKEKEKAKPVAGRVPAATELKGLRLYLNCDAIENGKMIDAVTKKAVGALNDGELIDGPRGKALRLTGKGGSDSAPGLALLPERVAIAAEKPFTFALWGRRPTGPAGGLATARLFAGTNKAAAKRSQFDLTYRPGVVVLTLLNPPQQAKDAPQFVVVQAPQADAGEWVHFAVVRDDKGEVRLLLNGEAAPGPKRNKSTAALEYETFGLSFPIAGKHTLEIDEFCLFDRALTDAEVKRLAGLEK